MTFIHNIKFLEEKKNDMVRCFLKTLFSSVYGETHDGAPDRPLDREYPK